MFRNINEKSVWEMNIEEQKEYYDKQSNEMIDVAITQIVRNKILLNKNLKEKIKKEIDKIIKEAVNDML